MPADLAGDDAITRLSQRHYDTDSRLGDGVEQHLSFRSGGRVHVAVQQLFHRYTPVGDRNDLTPGVRSARKIGADSMVVGLRQS